MKNIIFITIAVAFFSGCTTKLGSLSALSTQNINNLDANLIKNTKVQGKSCANIALLFFPYGELSDNVGIATKRAISQGKSQGLKGDVLINAQIDHSFWTALIFTRECVIVTGDLIELSKSIKK